MYRKVMKALLMGFIIVILISTIGFFLLNKNSNQATAPKTTQTPNVKVTKTGKIQTINPPGDDYTHLLISSEGNIKLNSYKVNLNDFEGKTVQIEGQYSGNTLFVDSIN